MKPSGIFLAVSALTLSLSVSWAYAQDGDGDETDVLEVTMRLLPPGAQASEEALRELTLPTRMEIDEETGEPIEVAIPSEQGQLHGGEGLLRANEARFEGVANGAAAAEAAQNNREELGRGTRPDLDELRPDNVPDDVPGPPENPGPP